MFRTLMGFVLCFSSLSFAQTVTRVSGRQALVSFEQSGDLQTGDRVVFLSHDLKTAGEGKVGKVSASGRTVLVIITSGKVQTGMTVENASEGPATPLPTIDKPVVASSREDERILRIGEIGMAQYVIGGVVGTYPLGLGIGHAIQGRYFDKGWIFTVGELGSFVVLAAGIGDCIGSSINSSSNCHGSGATLLTIGLASYVGFRIWEILDVWLAPLEINRRYRALQMSSAVYRFEPVLTSHGDQAQLGLRWNF